MATQIKCGVYDGDNSVIDKKVNVKITTTCRVTNPHDIIHPTVIVNNKDGLLECNYFVIGKRKYFKQKLTRTSNSIVTIQLEEDVVSTWIPRVEVNGIIHKATEVADENLKQNHPLLEKRLYTKKVIPHDLAHDSINRYTIIGISPCISEAKEE